MRESLFFLFVERALKALNKQVSALCRVNAGTETDEQAGRMDKFFIRWTLNRYFETSLTVKY